MRRLASLVVVLPLQLPLLTGQAEAAVGGGVGVSKGSEKKLMLGPGLCCLQLGNAWYLLRPTCTANHAFAQVVDETSIWDGVPRPRKAKQPRISGKTPHVCTRVGVLFVPSLNNLLGATRGLRQGIDLLQRALTPSSGQAMRQTARSFQQVTRCVRQAPAPERIATLSPSLSVSVCTQEIDVSRLASAAPIAAAHGRTGARGILFPINPATLHAPNALFSLHAPNALFSLVACCAASSDSPVHQSGNRYRVACVQQ